MKRTKTQKGITLIALIITIVVLLILAIVAINEVQGDGIISHAKYAQTKYQGESEKEGTTLAGYDLLLAQETGNAWKQDGTKVTKGDTTLEVGQTVIGNLPALSSTGNLWKVLGEENGKVLLMTSGSIGTKLLNEEYDGTGYYKGVEQLNKVCTDTIASTDVVDSIRSVTVEDINRVTGYKPEHNSITILRDNNNYSYYYDNNVNEPTTIDYEDSADNIFGILNVSENVIKGNASYFYKGNEYINSESKAYNLLFKENAIGSLSSSNGNAYWLASPCLSDWGYGLRYVFNNSNSDLIPRISMNELGNIGDYAYEQQACVRAVITLRSNVILTSNGTDGWTIS